MIVYGLHFKYCITVQDQKKKIVVAVFALETACLDCLDIFDIRYPEETFEVMTLDEFEDLYCEDINHGEEGRMVNITANDLDAEWTPPTVA